MPSVNMVRIGPPIAPKMEKAMRSTPAGTTCRRKASPIMSRPKATATIVEYWEGKKVGSKESPFHTISALNPLSVFMNFEVFKSNVPSSDQKIMLWLW